MIPSPVLVIENTNDINTLKVTGDLTIYHVANFHGILCAHGDFKGDVELDCSECEEMDTAGIQLVLALEKEVKEKGGEFRFEQASDECKEVLSLYNLAEHFNLTAGAQ
jgi:anti-sigma B factor antagonist